MNTRRFYNLKGAWFLATKNAFNSIPMSAQGNLIAEFNLEGISRACYAIPDDVSKEDGVFYFRYADTAWKARLTDVRDKPGLPMFDGERGGEWQAVNPVKIAELKLKTYYPNAVQVPNKTRWAIGTEAFGADYMGWLFVCPSCGNIQSPNDFTEYFPDPPLNGRKNPYFVFLASHICRGKFLKNGIAPFSGGSPCTYDTSLNSKVSGYPDNVNPIGILSDETLEFIGTTFDFAPPFSILVPK
jgi:hypothetical protein